MFQATAKRTASERKERDHTPVPQQPRTGIMAWLRTWTEVLVGELLRALEPRHWD